ncbi:MAG TPA: hypothetical protein VNT81_19135 [Vicinamibacterales bacterium]|nr:hypothetical protein [Vicinamibacterales bacterium]
MRTASLWIIRAALTVQFAAVLAVPSLLAAADSPRGMWMAEWLRPQSVERTIGVLTLRDVKLSFSEQVGHDGWEVELSKVKRVSQANDGRALLVVTVTGEEYVTVIMDPAMVRQSPKKVLSVIERSLQLQTVNGR